MKKIKKTKATQRGYDFSSGIRGKYAKHYALGSNVIVLEPDVAKTFHDSESVNKILRSLAEMIRQSRSSHP